MTALLRSMGGAAAPAGDRLPVAPRSLVVLGGLPGAGKTTLLRRLSTRLPAGVVALDAEEVTARLRAARRLVPYRLLRPLVHALHLVRVARAVGSPATVVVTTDPATSPLRRVLFAALARRSGRSLHLVVLDTTVDEAVQGQRQRGRALSSRRMRRHARRWQALRARLVGSGAPGPAPRPLAADGLRTADRCDVLGRSAAARLVRLHLTGG